MIISQNKRALLEEFRMLMKKTDELLNSEAKGKEDYYKKRNGTAVEEDVYAAIVRCAVGTRFEGTIELVSGASFPDIVANQYFGVEVKSTNKSHWKSVGSSILESTRDKEVEYIFLTFCKLGKPIEFKTRPYEECLSGISVTHYPRYQIDMELGQGDTIFDKMGVAYNDLRRMDNPVVPVSQYYRSKLKPGESLWWAGDANIEETEVPPTARLWNTLSHTEKISYMVKGYALFPEILGSGSSKYQRYALWLATSCGIVNTNIRDQFSAGGVVDVITQKHKFEKMPAVFGRIASNKEMIAETIISASEEMLKEYWQQNEICNDRIAQWCMLAGNAEKISDESVVNYKLLTEIFEV